MIEPTGFGFVMPGSRSAISQGLVHIKQQVETIENVISSNPGLVFDLSKAIVESTCRTILTDRGISWDRNDQLPRLFQRVRDSLSVLPAQESQEREIQQSIRQTLGGLHTVIQGLAELRNRLGFASHGSDRPRPQMETIQALLAAQAADTIVGFLYHVHSQDNRTSQTQRSQDFDQYVDAIHDGISIFDSLFRPSEVLYEFEPESYRIALAEFLDQSASSEEET